MGIVFEEEPEPQTEETVVEPGYGQAQVEILSDLIDTARAMGTPLGTHMIDCINARYRSKAYRDHIKSLSSTHISHKQVGEMRTKLNGIRHNRRTPHAKAYRHQWP